MDHSLENSRNKLAKSLIPLVHKVASHIARRLPPHVSLDDLIGAGLLGLAAALNRFDPSRARKFKGYAEYRIRGEILDELRRRDILSRDARLQSKRAQRAIQELNGKLGREALPEEIACQLGVSLESYCGFHQQLLNLRTVSSDEMEICLPHEGRDPYESVYWQEARNKLARAIERLPRQKRLVLWLYYYEELPLQEIAELLDVTSSRVCQIRTEAIQKLRNFLEENQTEQLAA